MGIRTMLLSMNSELLGWIFNKSGGPEGDAF